MYIECAGAAAIHLSTDYTTYDLEHTTVGYTLNIHTSTVTQIC